MITYLRLSSNSLPPAHELVRNGVITLLSPCFWGAKGYKTPSSRLPPQNLAANQKWYTISQLTWPTLKPGPHWASAHA